MLIHNIHLHLHLFLLINVVNMKVGTECSQEEQMDGRKRLTVVHCLFQGQHWSHSSSAKQQGEKRGKHIEAGRRKWWYQARQTLLITVRRALEGRTSSETFAFLWMCVRPSGANMKPIHSKRAAHPSTDAKKSIEHFTSPSCSPNKAGVSN